MFLRVEAILSCRPEAGAVATCVCDMFFLFRLRPGLRDFLQGRGDCVQILSGAFFGRRAGGGRDSLSFDPVASALERIRR